MKSVFPKHLITLEDLSAEQIKHLIARAIELKKQKNNHQNRLSLSGKVLAMIFEKSSTRTRISFEVGIMQLGGQAVFISSKDTHLRRGETIGDTAKVISSMVDCVVIRTDSHQKLIDFAACSQVPVINGLSDDHHPCQLLADLMTMAEHYNGIEQLNRLTLAWVGDGNNTCNSTIQLAKSLALKLNIYTPKGYEAKQQYDSQVDKITLFDTPEDAIRGVHVVSTDVWASMGDEQKTAQRQKDFSHCRIDSQKMNLADKEAIFLHCLPAHRGEEVTAEVIDGRQSKVWQQAENRLHTQKALLELLLL